MPPAQVRVAVDLSGDVIRVLEGTPGGLMRCGSGGTPPGAFVGGRVHDVAAVGAALRQLLARTDIIETRAMIGVSDAVAAFRVLHLPKAATDRDVAAAISIELQLGREHVVTQWIEVDSTPSQRIIYAASWNSSEIKKLTDAARSAGLEVAAVDLKSACVARVVPVPACVVLDVASDPGEIVLIDGYLPRVWHSFAFNHSGGDPLASLLKPLRSVLKFYQRQKESGFGSSAPILISGEHALPAHTFETLAERLAHPVAALPAPPRVPADVRHGTYLTCLGLIMRRS